MKRSSSDCSSSSSSESPGSSFSKRAKHREGFREAWKVQYPWLLPVHDRDEPTKVCGLMCQLCQQHKMTQRSGAGTWTVMPCIFLRKHIVDRHSQSNMHKEAIAREATRLSVERSGGIQQAFQTRVCLQRKALIGALKITYCLAKEEIPLTSKYEPFLELAMSLGCDYLKELEVGGNVRYRSHAIIGEFLKVLASVIEEKQLSDIAASKFYSLLTDESTDISVKKQLVLVARYLAGKEVKTAFIHIQDLSDGTANTITEAILSFAARKSLDINKLKGFASDGAAVMVGRHNGVATQLRQSSPSVISVHCVNHKLALAASHAADHIPYLQRFKTHLHNLFAFYQNSPVRMEGLHAIQSLLNDPKIKLKEAKDVRWLSHDAAITAILRTLPSLITSLDREASEPGEPTAVGLLRFVKTYFFIGTAHLLHKVLPHVSRLSLIFQKEDVDFMMIRPCLDATIAAVSTYKTDKLPQIYATISSELKDFDIPFSEAQEKAFQSQVQEKYITALVTQLQDRLPDIAELEAFSILDPSKLPAQSDASFSIYGSSQLELLSSRYGCGDRADVCKEHLSSEWEALKQLISQTYRHMNGKEFLALLSTDSTMLTMFPNLSTIALIARILPVSTAECERCFSTMKRIKSSLRNRMETETLDRLMRVSTEGPNLDEFNFDKSADLWGSLRQRRITIFLTTLYMIVQYCCMKCYKRGEDQCTTL